MFTNYQRWPGTDVKHYARVSRHSWGARLAERCAVNALVGGSNPLPGDKIQQVPYPAMVKRWPLNFGGNKVSEYYKTDEVRWSI